MSDRKSLFFGLVSMVAMGAVTTFVSADSIDQYNSPAATPGGGTTYAGGVDMNVLHYEDFTLGTSAYTDALIALGANVTFTADPFQFESLLQSGSYDAVIAAHQNSFALAGWEDDLVNWVGANPDAPVLISDWRVNNPDVYGYLGALGFSYNGATNPFQGNPVAGGVFDGLGTASLASPGWGIYGYATGGGTTEATTESGLPFVSRSGNVFFNGFLSDIFADASAGSEWVQRELLVPAPGVLAFLGLGALARRRRR